MAFIVGILESFLGGHKHHNEGTGQVSFDCPACSMEKGMYSGDGKGNLEVNYHLDVFRCWVCKDYNEMHGSITRLIKRYGTPKNLKDYRLFKPESFDWADRRNLDVKLPETYKRLTDSSSRDYKYDLAMYYLKSRGITDDIIKKYDIGWTTGGKYFNRIIFPYYDHTGKLIYWVGRWFEKRKNKMKYMNPEDTNKDEFIFNEPKINWDSTIYLVEGVTDHIVVPNSIPLLGKYVNDVLKEKLYNNAGADIVILLDADALKDALNIYDSLNFGNLKGRVKLCIPPGDEDPSSINEKLGKQGIIKLIANRTGTLEMLKSKGIIW
jgi:hypothetical protein